MIVVYKRASNREIRSEAKKSIPQIEKWFADHPERKDCNTSVWYGKMVLIRRDHVKEDMDKAMNEALAPAKSKKG